MNKEERGRIKRCKAFLSFQKERKWLEEMALQGWFLENISMGMIYTFRRGEPKHLLYGIDWFCLPKKPDLEEIRHKEIFMEMARELGWQEVTHDEDMTYYFSKEYEEGGINELHNDRESRGYRAAKFRRYAHNHAKKLVVQIFVVLLVDLAIKSLLGLWGKPSLIWYEWFALIYAVVCSAAALGYWKLGFRTEKELSMTGQEWEESRDPAFHKTMWKLILTNRGLNRFLGKQAGQGWVLTAVTPLRYFFVKDQSKNQIYTMDSKSLVNKRLKAQSRKQIGDGKDWSGINSDWELQSVRDAQEKGWIFVCALENRAVIYRGEAGQAEPLNDPRYDNSLRWVSLIGEYGFYMLLSAIAGGIVGFIIGYLEK